MNETIRGWVTRGLMLAGIVAGVSASSTASAVTCNFPSFETPRGETCAQGTSVARLSGSLVRPPNESAFFHLEIDMQGGELGAVAWPIDENGTVLEQFTVADLDPTTGEFESTTFNNVFGRGGDVVIDEFEDFQHPLDLVGIEVTVI
jgi:hypothetical protein